MHVLILIDQFTAGGLETHLLGKVDALRRLGARVTCMGARLSDMAPPDFQRLDLAKDIPASRFLAEVARLTAFCQTEQVTHIHCHCPFVGVLGACVSVRCNIPYFLTIHGMFQAARKVNQTLGLLISKMVFPCAAAVYPVSSAARDCIVATHGVPQQDQTVMMNAVGNWQRSPPAPPDHGKWAFVARHEKEHVDALRHLVAAMPSLPISSLHVFGDGAESERARAMTADNPAVEFHGFVENISERLAEFDGIACHGERVFLETMAAGRPCLICHRDGVIGLSSPSLIERTRFSNFTGEGQSNISVQALQRDWERLIGQDNIRACQDLLRPDHDADLIWARYVKTALHGHLPPKDRSSLEVALAAAHKLDDGNLIFCRPDFLGHMKDILPPYSQMVSALNDTGFVLMRSEITTLRRKLRVLRRTSLPAN
ncbi:glycosyltransferase family 4 protein [Falsiruegeria mediterranea]|uniref:Glycosyltransferase subfamily 4-like N-terminal domain-containing protein n=1 Tax=Falsiruegeria mediterranea M17 TaxID=1200281 RepID=A0A2R8CFX0_9RHOB|nr:glycosyltransferase family 4 protein [Falsiruegeria mediterranea]SPJ31344.1 hypothetical protein TRM7615_04887 [Falsiruegeria mediterranea M17]